LCGAGRSRIYKVLVKINKDKNQQATPYIPILSSPISIRTISRNDVRLLLGNLQK
jgi:hypothetical protein